MPAALADLHLTHLNLDARDLDASYRFYGVMLGLPVIRRDGMLRVEQPGYLLVINAGEPQIGGSFHFGFRVADAADVDAWIKRLRGYGVPIVVEPERSGAVYVARVTDPDGYPIEIYADP
jgi:catechol 2,3-dioxygenase-like lactoylglutathione lyase family enzyme